MEAEVANSPDALKPLAVSGGLQTKADGFKEEDWMVHVESNNLGIGEKHLLTH